MAVARFLLTPRWLVAHVVVVAIAVLFINLGLWQLRRLDERRADNALIAERMSAPERPLDEVVAELGDDPRDLAYRRVRATGTYASGEEVLLTPRTSGERPGHHVVTPLRTDGGKAVLVERGWVPFEMDIPPVPAATPPTGEVTVEGIVVPTQTASRFGAPGGGDRLTFLSAVDTERLQPQVADPLCDCSLLLVDSQPAVAGALPVPPAPLDLSEGPHLSYALQWFAFTAIGLVGYPLLVRKSLRARSEAPAGGGAGAGLGPGRQRPPPHDLAVAALQSWRWPVAADAGAGAAVGVRVGGALRCVPARAASRAASDRHALRRTGRSATARRATAADCQAARCSPAARCSARRRSAAVTASRRPLASSRARRMRSASVAGCVSQSSSGSLRGGDSRPG